MSNACYNPFIYGLLNVSKFVDITYTKRLFSRDCCTHDDPGDKATLERNVREYRRGDQKWTIKRNWQHRVHKTKKNKTKTQHNMKDKYKDVS